MTGEMKAGATQRFGEPLNIREVDVPAIGPGINQPFSSEVRGGQRAPQLRGHKRQLASESRRR